MIKKPWLSRFSFRSPPKTSKDLQVQADERGPEAQNNLGAFFAHTEHLVAAASSYRKAAEHGNAMAQNNLAMMYAAGEGVLRDEAEAGKWFCRAAEQGDSAAQFHLGNRFHRRSLSLPKLEAEEARIEAFKWLELAHAQGYPNAEVSRELVNLRMSREDVVEGNRRVRCFIAMPEGN